MIVKENQQLIKGLLEGFVGKTYLMKDWLKDDRQMLLGEIIVCNIIPSFMIAKKS
jgi:hypothetical protein